MPASDRVRCRMTDLNGAEAISLFYVDPASASGFVQTGANALCALSRANKTEVSQEISRIGPLFALGDDGDFPTHHDMVTLQFSKTGGGYISITMSAPHEDIFLADTETVDTDQGDVATWIAWYIANGRDDANTTIAAYVRGWRWFLGT